MKPPNPFVAQSGLVVVALAWVIVLLLEMAANPLPTVARAAIVAGLIVGVLKGNRLASAMLVVWSVVGIALGGSWETLFLMAVGVALFLWAGGSRAFRVTRPATGPSDSTENAA